MGDRTYVFRLRGDGGELQAVTAAAGGDFDKLGAKAGDFGAKASSAGKAVAGSFATQGAAAKGASHDIEGFSFATAGAKRELLVLAHELSQGNFSRFGGSLLVLGERTGAASLLFSGLGIAALATVGILAGVASQVIKGYIEQDRFNKSLLLTGNYAGQTNDSLSTLSRTLSQTTGTTVGSARELTTAFVATGQIGPRLIGPLGDAFLRLQKLSGESTEKIAKQAADLASEPTKAALELNKQYNFLTVQQFEQIRHLEELGQRTDAALVASKALSDHLAGPQKESLGTINTLIKGTNQDLSSFVDWLRSIGREETAEAKLDSLYSKLARLKAANAAGDKFNTGIPGSSGALNQGEQERTQQQIYDELQAEAGKKRAAFYKADDAETQKAGIAAKEKLNSLDQQIKGTDRLAKAKADLAAQEAAETKAARLTDPSFNIDPKVHAARIAELERQNQPRLPRQDPGQGLLQAIAGQREQIQLELKQVESGGKLDEVQKFLVVSGEKLVALNGRISASTKSRIQAELAALKAEDQRLQAEKLAKVIADDVVKQSEQTQRLTLEAANDIDKYVDAQGKEITSINAEAAALTLSAQARAKLAAEAKLDQQYQATDRQLALLQQKAIEEGNTDALFALAAQRRELQQQTDLIRGQLDVALDERFKKETDGYTGIQIALQKYQDDAANASTFAQRTVGGGLEKLTDDLATFEETGKGHFRNVFVFMAEEFIKQLDRMVIAQASANAKGLLSTFASLFGFGGADGAGGATNAEGPYPASILGTAASGGDFRAGRAVRVGEHGPELLVMGQQGGRVLTNNMLRSSGSGKNAAGLQIHVHNNVGAQIGIDQDAEGRINVRIDEAMQAATAQGAQLGAQRGHAMVANDLASGSGRASTALRARGVNLGAGPARR